MNSIPFFIGHLIILSCVATRLEGPVAATGGAATKPILAADTAPNHLQHQAAETKPQALDDAKPASSPNSPDLTGLGPNALQQIVNIKQLRKRIQENLQLTASQTSNIDRLFASFVDQIIKDAGELRKIANTPIDKRQSSGLKGDRTPEWIAMIKAELNPDQVAVFERVAKRWIALKGLAPRRSPLEHLRRAIHDPEIGITDEQRKEFEVLLTKTRRSIRAGEQRPTPEMMAEAAEKVRTEIYEKLTPEQEAKMEADLRYFDEEAEEYARLVANMPKQQPDDGN